MFPSNINIFLNLLSEGTGLSSASYKSIDAKHKLIYMEFV